MKNESGLYNDYVLATLIGALIFAAGYFVRDFNSLNTLYRSSPSDTYESVSAMVPPPPGDVPPPPSVSFLDGDVNAAAVSESFEEE